MQKLTVNPQKDGFLSEDGSSFFYFADTCWGAFTNISIGEWEEYLDFRRRQCFDALQINILPQWDRSRTEQEFHPFSSGPDGKPDYFHPEESYFKRTRQFLKAAVDRGFLPVLAVLWCNYVPGTWASRNHPELTIPFEAVKPYAAFIAHQFAEFHPVYLISGDTDFKTQETIRYYLAAMRTIKSVCPDSLTSFHLAGGLTDLPEEIEKSPDLDFYMYQSGHGRESQHLSYEMAEAFSRKSVKRPVVNGEPCYEGHGFGNEYGRFCAFDVRKAIWSSLLSGAKAGFAYGVHGIWDFHRKGAAFPSEAFSKMPFPWRTALQLPGAWDASFARRVFEDWGFADLEPADLLIGGFPGIRTAVSKSGDKIAVYLPYALEVTLRSEWKGFRWTLVNLRERRFENPDVILCRGKTVIQMPDINGDALIFGRKLS